MAGSATEQRSLYDTPLSEVFPRLTVEGRLASTPSSAVLRARQHSPVQRAVAVKIIAKNIARDKEAVRRFAREAETATGLRHPNIVEVYESDSYAGVPYLVMELVDGGDLATAIEKKLDVDEILRIGIGLARALAHIHQARLVHRDVKPANVLLGSAGEVKLTDFGMVKLDAGSGLTSRDTCMGTPEYMPPEQIESFKAVGPAADVYSAGATLYHALYGQSPFADASVVRQLKRTLRSRPEFPPRDDVPENLVKLLACCLEKDPRRRFRDGEELLQNLKRVRVRREPRLPSRLRLPVWRLAIGAGFGIALLALVLVALSRG